jgi:BMFP domain-containing protein YqiC
VWAEVERLRMRVSSLETQWAESDTAAAIFQAMSRAEQAEAEVERLRAALERISDLTHTDDCGCQAAPIEECGCQPSMREIARVVLRGEGVKATRNECDRADRFEAELRIMDLEAQLLRTRAELAAVHVRVKQLEAGHDDWRTKAHRATNHHGSSAGLREALRSTKAKTRKGEDRHED